MEDVEDECLVDFFRENEIYCFRELFLDIYECNVKNVKTLKKTKIHHIKIISFVYKKIMDFPTNEFDAKIFVSKIFYMVILLYIIRIWMLKYSVTLMTFATKRLRNQNKPYL